MASGLKSTDKNHFEATYEHPWGGVSSEAYKTDIAPNQFETADNVTFKNGRINSALFDDLGFNTSPIDSTPFNPIRLSFYLGNVLTGYASYILDSLGNIYLINWNSKTFTLTASNAGCQNADSVKVINSVAYIFSFGQGASFTFDGITLANNSAYVGGKYCTVVDQYLITANTNQPTDAPTIKHNRVNWSSPDGFSIWDPAADRSAGFNTLADTSDAITGLFAMANVAFVLRGQGLTQMTPTGIGIQPFDFTPLWSSDTGIGCLYPDTLDQYGNFAIWANDSGFYLFSGGAPEDITKQAKAAIFRDLKQGTTGAYLKLNAVSVIYNSTATDSTSNNITPALRYTVCIYNVISSLLISLIFWTYDFNGGTWTRQTKNVAGTGISTVFASFLPCYIPKSQSTQTKQIPLLCLSYQDVSATTKFKFISIYEATLDYPAGAPNPIAIKLNFKAEQVKIGRRPNIRGVAIIAKGKAGTPQTLKIDIQNELNVVHFADIVVTDDKVRTYISNGMFTSENPQLVISSSSFDGVIIKAMPYGTFADGELP